MHRILRYPALLTFLVSTLLMNVVGQLGLLMAPLLVQDQFPVFDLFVIEPSDVVAALGLTALGTALIVLAHAAVVVALPARRRASTRMDEDGRYRMRYVRRSLILGILVAAAGAVLIVDVIVRVGPAGVVAGLIGGPEASFAARRTATERYLFSLFAYNILPFTTTILLLLAYPVASSHAARSRGAPRLVFFLTGFITLTALILTFQKRPIAVFVLMMLVGRWTLTKYRGALHLRRRLRFVVAGLAGLALIVLLMGYSTTHAFRDFGVVEGAQRSTVAVASRAVGRLALVGPMYMHLFPGAVEHYALRNTRIAGVLGFDTFADTPLAYEYFTDDDRGGSMAVPAIFDFWGGFGLSGVLFGSLILGVILGAGDAAVNSMSLGPRRSALIVVLVVFSWFLTQASLIRSLGGYGGLPLLLLWISVFRVRRRSVGIGAGPKTLRRGMPEARTAN